MVQRPRALELEAPARSSILSPSPRISAPPIHAEKAFSNTQAARGGQAHPRNPYTTATATTKRTVDWVGLVGHHLLPLGFGLVGGKHLKASALKLSPSLRPLYGPSRPLPLLPCLLLGPWICQEKADESRTDQGGERHDGEGHPPASKLRQSSTSLLAPVVFMWSMWNS